MTALKITPLQPSIGAEVAGVDLSKPFDEASLIECLAAAIKSRSPS